MDIQALKIELIQKLVMLNDATILASTKQYLDMLLRRDLGSMDDQDKAMMAAAALFGQHAYGDKEPDISKPGLTSETSNIEYFFGTLKLKPEAFEEDSRGREELRKTEYYEQMKKDKRKRS
jgi:hypothetical protein